MAHRQLKTVMELLFIHLEDATKHSGSPPTDAISLLCSKIRKDSPEGEDLRVMDNLLDILFKTNHPTVFNHLVDSFVAVQKLLQTLDLSYNSIGTNFLAYDMLYIIRLEIVKLLQSMIDREEAINGGTVMDIDGDFPAAARADFVAMDPFEVLGIQNNIRLFEIDDWKLAFVIETKGVFEAEQLGPWLVEKHPGYN